VEGVTRVLRPEGVFVLNAKNHVQRGEEVLVVERHLGLLEPLGFVLEDAIFVPTKGHQGAGSNRDARSAGEWVMRLLKPAMPFLTPAPQTQDDWPKWRKRRPAA
jgi:hypothetical protein